MRKLLTTLVVAAGMGLALSAAAGEGQMDKAMATQMDENQDGQISKSEYMKHSKDMSWFEKMDKNKDGMLTPEELGFQFK